jgi:hypothetical protein
MTFVQWCKCYPWRVPLATVLLAAGLTLVYEMASGTTDEHRKLLAICALFACVFTLAAMEILNAFSFRKKPCGPRESKSTKYK